MSHVERYAIVEAGVVTNVILWDGVADFSPRGILLPVGDEVAVGWLHDGDQWIAPEPPEPEPAPEEDPARVAALAKLIALGLTEEEALALAGG